MFRHLLPLLWACTLAGCRDGDSLSDFHQRKLILQVTPLREEGEFQFTARLQKDDIEAGCRRLDSGVTATLNGEPLVVFPGNGTPGSDGPCGSPPLLPSFTLRGDAARFAGPPRDGLLEIRDGDERMVAEFRNLLGRHTLARLEAPLTVKPGQEVSLAWDPPTDELPPDETYILLDNTRGVRAVPEAGGLRVTFPADLPAGPVKVRAQVVPQPRVPQLRCEGIETCGVALDADLRAPEELEVLIQP